MSYMNNWEGPGYWDNDEQRGDSMESWAKEKADRFEECVASFLKHPIQAKAFAMCIATAIQDSDAAPCCMDFEYSDADCFMYINTVPTKYNAKAIEFQRKIVENHFDERI